MVWVLLVDLVEACVERLHKSNASLASWKTNSHESPIDFTSSPHFSLAKLTIIVSATTPSLRLQVALCFSGFAKTAEVQKDNTELLNV